MADGAIVSSEAGHGVTAAASVLEAVSLELAGKLGVGSTGAAPHSQSQVGLVPHVGESLFGESDSAARDSGPLLQHDFTPKGERQPHDESADASCPAEQQEAAGAEPLSTELPGENPASQQPRQLQFA